jgi:hypothetical protein
MLNSLIFIQFYSKKNYKFFFLIFLKYFNIKNSTSVSQNAQKKLLFKIENVFNAKILAMIVQFYITTVPLANNNSIF